MGDFLQAGKPATRAAKWNIQRCVFHWLGSHVGSWQTWVQILVTILTLLWIARLVPWRDRVRLPRGQTAVVLQCRGSELLVQPLGSSKGPPQVIPVTPTTAIEPGVGSLLARIRLPWLLAYLAGCLGVGILLILRWHRLLSCAVPNPSFDLSASRSAPAIFVPPSVRWCALTWARSQVINALPLSQVGGDLYRIERGSHFVGSAAVSLGIVATERLVGLVALAGAAGVGLAASGMLPAPIQEWSLAVASLAALAAVAMLIGRAGQPRVKPQAGCTSSVRQPAGREETPANRPPAPHGLGPALSTWRRSTSRMLAPLSHLAKHPQRLLTVLGLSFGTQLLAPLTFVAVDRALGFDTPVWCYLVAVPAVALAMFLPIHIAGVGILEGGLWLFLSRWSARSSADIIAISAAARVGGLIWLGMLSGSFLWALEGPRRRSGTNQSPMSARPRSTGKSELSPAAQEP